MASLVAKYKPSRSWALAYAVTVVVSFAFGLWFRQAVLKAVVAQMQFSVLEEKLLAKGSWIGLIISAIILPLVVPWVYALVAKLLSLFTDSRMLFADFYRLFQWGYCSSSLIAIGMKCLLVAMLPVERWAKISLGIAALLPPDVPRLMTVAGSVIDLPLLILILTPILMLERRKREMWIVGWTGLFTTAVQVWVLTTSMV